MNTKFIKFRTSPNIYTSGKNSCKFLCGFFYFPTIHLPNLLFMGLQLSNLQNRVLIKSASPSSFKTPLIWLFIDSMGVVTNFLPDFNQTLVRAELISKPIYYSANRPMLAYHDHQQTLLVSNHQMRACVKSSPATNILWRGWYCSTHQVLPHGAVGWWCAASQKAELPFNIAQPSIAT